MLKLRDGRQVQVTLGVKPYSSNAKAPSHHTQEIKENETVEEDQSQSLEGKRQYLQTVGVDDCLKDKVSQCYLLQIQDVQVRSKQSNASGNSHYHLKMKSKQTKALKLPKKFEYCHEEWGSDEEEDKLTTPISVPSHYKKYKVEVRKVVIQKPNKVKEKRQNRPTSWLT